jgi:hypothetical protein
MADTGDDTLEECTFGTIYLFYLRRHTSNQLLFAKFDDRISQTVPGSPMPKQLSQSGNHDRGQGRRAANAKTRHQIGQRDSTSLNLVTCPGIIRTLPNHDNRLNQCPDSFSLLLALRDNRLVNAIPRDQTGNQTATKCQRTLCEFCVPVFCCRACRLHSPFL